MMANPTKALLRLFVLLLVIGASLLLYSARSDLKPPVTRLLSGEGNWFAAAPPPINPITQIFDMGIVDANGDGRLDIYTSNHNYKEYLLLADSQGGYRNVVSEWGLDQSRSFPGWEQASQAPDVDKAGLYIYWLDDTLHFRAHNLDKIGAVKGTLRIFSPVQTVKNDGFRVETRTTSKPTNPLLETTTEFAASGDAHLALYINSRGGPFTFNIGDSLSPANVYMGLQKVSPSAHTFSVSLRDRHGMAWADINHDDQLDVFISRGAIAGTLREFPENIRRSIADELFISEAGQPRFHEVSREAGIEKKDCSGRHAKWVDFDQDGLLDLYINCQDRGNVPGGYPKQFYRQDAKGRFSDISAEVGLDIPQHQLIDFAWFDADSDGDMDLLSHEDTGYFLYRNQGGKFTREFIYRGKFERADVKGLKKNTYDYWQFDGKLSLADFDSDGDLDVFVASKKGNAFLINNAGTFKPLDPAALGLPVASVAAAWVDYDNDSHPDLHTVPEGVFHQNKSHTFDATGFLSLPAQKYQAAIINWFDRDNDGAMDVLIALQDNATLWRWWEKPFKSKDVKGEDDRFKWKILDYRHVGKKNHWLQLNLVGSAGNPQAIGARVTLITPEGKQVQQVGASEGAYLSQGHYRLYFGLGAADKISAMQIHWPDGRLEELHNIKVNTLLTVKQGN